MAVSLSIAAILMLAQGPATILPVIDTGADVGTEALAAGNDGAALAAIEACDELPANDPARLINHGIALARMGRTAEARLDFAAAATTRERIELETADGQWVDSRRLARRALALLDRGDFARGYALAAQ